MLHWIDSHCHLDRLETLTPEKAIEAAQEAGVQHILSVCVQLEEVPRLYALAEQHPSVACSIGVHPTEAQTLDESVEALVAYAQHESVIAIGETGLDFYREDTPALRRHQHARFERHMQAALQMQKPVIVHTRQARQETIAALKPYVAQGLQGVLHCFTEDLSMAQAALDLGFYLSFSGIITFKNAEALREVVMYTPDDRLLIETDAPYLAPVPYRGKMNQPAYVVDVGACVARLKGWSLESCAYTTRTNTLKLFPFKEVR